jgi:hypothetical protein
MSVKEKGAVPGSLENASNSTSEAEVNSQADVSRELPQVRLPILGVLDKTPSIYGGLSVVSRFHLLV